MHIVKTKCDDVKKIKEKNLPDFLLRNLEELHCSTAQMMMASHKGVGALLQCNTMHHKKNVAGKYEYQFVSDS